MNSNSMVFHFECRRHEKWKTMLLRTNPIATSSGASDNVEKTVKNHSYALVPAYLQPRDQRLSRIRANRMTAIFLLTDTRAGNLTTT